VSIVADGSPAARERLLHGLDADTGLGVLRYADAGYDLAVETARSAGVGRVSDSDDETRSKS
jgi:urocanate hydratase